MSAQDRLQSADARPEQDPRAFDRTRRLREILGLRADRQLLSTATIAREFDFPSRAAVRMFLRRHARPGEVERVGRGVRVDRVVFQAICLRTRRTVKASA